MKPLKFYKILILSTLVLLFLPMIGLAGDPPPVEGNPTEAPGGTPIGGGAPIGSGLLFMIALSGSYLVYSMKKNFLISKEA